MAMKQRLDAKVFADGLVRSRSQAENYIRLGYVFVDGIAQTKPGFLVQESSRVEVRIADQYVSRAALKLASVAAIFKIDFQNKTVLDVGSSTGGFTEFALKHGAQKVIAVELGTDQMHPSLRGDDRIELHEQTDIRSFKTHCAIDIVVADVSFISLREILPSVQQLSNANTIYAVMVKPQFEAVASRVKHHGVVKNEKQRRAILADFEMWAKQHFVLLNKADSSVSGTKGNVERFYLLKNLPKN